MVALTFYESLKDHLKMVDSIYIIANSLLNGQVDYDLFTVVKTYNSLTQLIVQG